MTKQMPEQNTPRNSAAAQTLGDPGRLGVFCSGICFVIQSVEQQFTTASHASLIFTLEPVFSAVFAYFLLSERLTVRGYFGAALMLVSLLIMELDVPALLKKDEKAP